MICRYNDYIKNSIIQHILTQDKTGEKTKISKAYICFDIETSLQQEDEEYRTWMYSWQIRVGNIKTYGRKWQEFEDLVNTISKKLKKVKIYCFVHNLSFEFAFIKKRFPPSKVFAGAIDHPFYYHYKNVIFQCTYKMSGLSLKNLAQEITIADVSKRVGDIDHRLKRNDKTPLTDKELGYIEADVDIIHFYIQQSLLEYGELKNIPITNTGRVRKELRHRCFGDSNRSVKAYAYRDRWLKDLDPLQYKQICKVIMGGHTHANITKVNRKIKNVISYDVSSSYPFVIFAKKFAVTEGRIATENFDYYLKNKYCIFDVKLKNVKLRINAPDSIIPSAKCFGIKDMIVDNNKLLYAKEITTSCTSEDFNWYKTFYDFDIIGFDNFYWYETSYLPAEIILFIVELFKNKTSLKDVEGSESLYMKSKNMINALFGMMCMNPLQDEFKYNPEFNVWTKQSPDVIEGLKAYNSNRNRFINYIWGLQVTSHARCRLWEGIWNAGTNYIYSDTDSIYLNNENNEKFESWVKFENEKVVEEIKNVCFIFDIDFEECKPKTPKGAEKMLGLWLVDGIYKNFKTLGSKRYLTEDEEGYKLTCAGIPKKSGTEFLIDTGKPFTTFNEKLYFPPIWEKDGIVKHLDFYQHYIINVETKGECVDYLGNKSTYNELTSIYLLESGKNITTDEIFLNLANAIKDSGNRMPRYSFK